MRATNCRDDLAQLLGLYRRPVYAFLRQKRFSPHDAADLSQAFIVHVLEKDLVRKADRDRGRFRSFLSKCLMHFVRDHPAVPGGPPRSGPSVISPEDFANMESARADSGLDPAREFDRQWAVAILHQVRERLESECRAHGMDRHWEAYEARVLQPMIVGGQPTSVESLAQSMNLPAPQVSHMIENVRRKSARMFREAVADTLDDPADLDDEIKALCAALEGRSGA